LAPVPFSEVEGVVVGPRAQPNAVMTTAATMNIEHRMKGLFGEFVIDLTGAGQHKLGASQSFTK
jgi:hypothetical protein